MSQMEIDQVLAQIRSLTAQMRPAAPPTATSGTAPVSDFASLLRQGIDQVSQAQQHAGALADAFERGTSGVELPEVMLEMQKANVSFRALTEVRNRLISAYQEIMSIPI